MKSGTHALLVTSIALGCWAAADESLRLQLESPARTLRLGETAQLKLTITGGGVAGITEQTEGVNADHTKAGAFVYGFEFQPQRTGRFPFGPYSLSVNGQALTSNALSVEVLPQWDGTHGTFFRVDTHSIPLGGEVELTAETWADKMEYKSIVPDWNGTFTVRTGGSTSRSSKVGREGALFHSRTSWFITPTKAGEFKIHRQFFRQLPDGIVPPDITITVVEPAQPGLGK